MVYNFIHERYGVGLPKQIAKNRQEDLHVWSIQNQLYNFYYVNPLCHIQYKEQISLQCWYAYTTIIVKYSGSGPGICPNYIQTAWE